MSISSTIAKAVPEKIARRQIAKNEYDGDDWNTVGTVIQTMCEIRSNKDHSVDFMYKGKAVGWAKPNGTCWCDGNAYREMREEYKHQIECPEDAIDIDDIEIIDDLS